MYTWRMTSWKTMLYIFCSCFIISNRLCNWVGPFWSIMSAPTLFSRASIVCFSWMTSFRPAGLSDGKVVMWFRWSSVSAVYWLFNKLKKKSTKQKSKFYFSSTLRGHTPWFFTILNSSGIKESGTWICLKYWYNK